MEDYVRSLELCEFETSLLRDSVTEVAENKAEGYVDSGSLVAFTEEVTGQNKFDVLNSTLLAQLAANKVADRQTENDKWYKKYTEVLMNVGWVAQEFHFSQYKSEMKSFEISEAVIELLLALVGDAAPALVAIVKKTLDAMKKSDQGTINLFGANATSGNNGNFQIVPCTVDKSGQVSVGFIGFYFKADQVRYDFLFFTYKDAQIDLQKYADFLTLNAEVYGNVRQAVVEKLGNRAQSYVKILDI